MVRTDRDELVKKKEVRFKALAESKSVETDIQANLEYRSRKRMLAKQNAQIEAKRNWLQSFNIEVIVTDPRGVAASASLLVSSAEPGFIIQQFYTGLSSILGVGVTVFAYLWLRRRIAKHRRKFPFVNHLRKVLNLSYYDFTRFDGDAYKTKVNDFFQKLPLEFYNELTPQEQRSFAVCVAEILVKRGLVYRSDTFGGFFGICCWLNVGWPNDLDLKKFDVQSHAIAVEALNSWKGDQQPLNRWAYHSPSTHEKFHVFCCCTKPASAKRWPAVALTELKTHEGTTP